MSLKVHVILCLSFNSTFKYYNIRINNIVVAAAVYQPLPESGYYGGVNRRGQVKGGGFNGPTSFLGEITWTTRKLEAKLLCN